jgi:hypothetical protein
MFGIYYDELLLKLKQSGYGCHIGDMFAGAFGYADDASILTPTKYGLNKMLCICNEFSKEFNIMFNPSKSSLIVHTPNGPLSTSAIFNGELIQSEKNAIHLGNIVGYIREEEKMSKCVGEFYGKVNLLLSQFGSVNENIRYSLFKTYCMPLYGCQLWNMSSRSINLLFTAWRKCVRRIWQVHPMTHCNLLHLICNDLPVEQQIHKRFLKFLFSILESKNKIIYLCGQLALCGSQSKLGNNINYLCDIYNISKYI